MCTYCVRGKSVSDDRDDKNVCKVLRETVQLCFRRYINCIYHFYFIWANGQPSANK